MKKDNFKWISGFDKLILTTSKKEKIKIIQEYKDVPYFLDLLKILINPFLNTHIKKLPEMQFNYGGLIIPPNKFIELVGYLANLKARNNEAEQKVISFLSKCGLEGKYYQDVLTKKLKIGVKVKLINEALGYEFIPDTTIMKAYDINKIDINEIKFPVAVEEKLDGVRCLIYKNENEINAVTYNGSVLNLPHIFDELKNKPDGYYDGELLANTRQETSGLVNKVIKETATEQEKQELNFYCFDYLTIREWNNLKSYCPTLKDRRVRLLKILGGLDFENKGGQNLRGVKILNNRNFIRLVEQFVCDNLIQVKNFFDEVKDKNGEGIMLKDLNGIYEKKRSKKWIKYKGLESCTLKIVNWFEGEGKYKGKIGGFICQTEDEKFKIKVGSGLTDEIRELDGDKLIGKLVEIYYTDLYYITNTNKEKQLVMDFPRFKEFRIDKDRADYLKELVITKIEK